jgi:hypothetical protein
MEEETKTLLMLKEAEQKAKFEVPYLFIKFFILKIHLGL